MSSEMVEIITAIIAAGSTLGLLFLTGFYVVYTYKLLQATDRPEVIVFLYYEEGVLDVQSPEPNRCKLSLCVQNVGRRTARDISIVLEGISALPRSTVVKINGIDFLQDGIPLLPPDRMIYNIINVSDRFIDIFDEVVYKGRSSKVDVRVKYQDAKGKKYNDKFALDFLHPTFM